MIKEKIQIAGARLGAVLAMAGQGLRVQPQGRGSLAQVLRCLLVLQDPRKESCPCTHAAVTLRLLVNDDHLHVEMSHCSHSCAHSDFTPTGSLPPSWEQRLGGEGGRGSRVALTSSTLKMAAVRATCPATKVANSVFCVLSMMEPGTAIEMVQFLPLDLLRNVEIVNAHVQMYTCRMRMTITLK